MINLNLKDLFTKTISRAEEWQKLANIKSNKNESDFKVKMEAMLTNNDAKHLFIELIDRCFRPKNSKKVADKIISTIDNYGTNNLFSKQENALIFLFRLIGVHFPNLSVPLIIKKIRSDTKSVVLPAEEKELKKFIESSYGSNIRLNFNLIGEVILSEKEAKKKIGEYIELLKKPYITYLSVKISNLYSQINSFAYNETLAVLKPRIASLYREAKKSNPPKFINLDMEEYRDMDLTIDAFKAVLEQDEFKNFSAGIVLQAYIPESYNRLKLLCDWNKKRVLDGGSPIKIRIVKGANMEMELIEASDKGWPLTSYASKSDTDANYKKMILLAYQNNEYLKVGIATHNIFEMAFAYEAALEFNIIDSIEFEVLEGMADANLKTLQNYGAKVLVYVPIVKKEEFINAIAYLIRRLDENTAVQNFLRYSLNLEVEGENWKFLKDIFTESFSKIETVSNETNRLQNRNKTTIELEKNSEFKNSSDTDFTRKENRVWADEIRKKWSVKNNISIPCTVGGKDYTEGLDQKTIYDKSLQNEVAIANLASTELVYKSVEIARENTTDWSKTSLADKEQLFKKVAIILEENRGDFIGATAAETGKIFTETDVEVSEAIDFVNYYPKTVAQFSEKFDLSAKGVGVVVSPWNFSVAIPIGGIVAALATGNTVLFKPSSSAILCGYLICKCFWEAGISKNVLQFIPCSASKLESNPLIDPKFIDFVIFTGGTDTALNFKTKHPKLELYAETGGKNATIVTAYADKEQVIKNVIHSAFSNNGQKCSATSLLLLEEEIFKSKHFKKQLLEAAKSLKVGNSWNYDTKISPLTNKPGGNLLKALNIPEEKWLLYPTSDSENKNLLSPGIIWNVKPNDFCHLNELFGPVLAVMSFKNLEEAIDIVNQTGYGLTSGIETLNIDEQNKWKNTINAGNLYINRTTTGAIVQRQPFGGYGWSSFGTGIKAGGPNYVTNFMTFKNKKEEELNTDFKLPSYFNVLLNSIIDSLPKTEKEVFKKTYNSYVFWCKTYFSEPHDPSKIRGETNQLIYKPVGKVTIKVNENDTLFNIACKILAAEITGCVYTINIDEKCDLLHLLEKIKLNNGSLILNDQSQLLNSIEFVNRILITSSTDLPDKCRKQAVKFNTHINASDPTGNGRLDLLPFLKEQAISNSFHRYGNLGAKKNEIE